MKWFFRITAIIIACFTALVAIGYVTSPDLLVEQDIVVEALPEEVFPYLENLSYSNAWSPWYARQPEANYIFTGPEQGVGAHVMWRNDNESGNKAAISSQEIIAVQPAEFVQSELQLGGIAAKATYALIANNDDTVLVYIKYEQHLGDTPYIQRLLKTREHKILSREFETALQRLKAITESGVE
ncbi:MAG: hypothetical protein ACPGVT_08920 [Maricaulaceae bacterium]